MSGADRLAVEAGVASLTLMENAGRAVAEEAACMVPRGGRIAVLCGPGNNGGDGFVAARHLKRAGFDVRVFLLGEREVLKGDAAEMARRWDGAIRPPHVADPGSMDLVVDALFGAGLSRAAEGEAASAIATTNDAGRPVLAVDLPSGLDGNTGAPCGGGPVMRAARTVTFFRRKPAHLLLPGRLLCGEVVVADIGIPAAILANDRFARPSGKRGTATSANGLALWRPAYPWPRLDGHKYDRGHAVVVSGPAHSTGAARLGARAALRIGAGLVTVAGPPAATAINAAHLTSVMVRALGGPSALADLLSDERLNAVLYGPGAGVGEETAAAVAMILRSPAAVVLDADALSSCAGEPPGGAAPVGFGFTPARRSAALGREHVFDAIRRRAAPVVLTPHEGEFKRLFPECADGSKLDRARAAASSSGAIVVLKGADTVIASPDGRAVINDNAPPWLATAGSGDVLAGFITGLLAQRMPAFEAACAGVWLHGECAAHFGPGLIAEDLSELLPRVLQAKLRPE
ncbi:MAG: NAD(P)H-hydrate dehydratase [Hyphomicrobium sp.]